MRKVTFADLSETPDPSLLPPLDRPDDGTIPGPMCSEWRKTGAVILPQFMNIDAIDAYVEERSHVPDDFFKRGYPGPTPYEYVETMRRLCLQPSLQMALEILIGEPMMLHLCLTPWVSTERNWHQDDYLNPPHVNSWYAAVWIALDDIHPDSGPFEYIPGSHTWPLMRREKVLAHLTPEEREAADPISGAKLWPKLSERIVTPAIEDEIAARGIAPKQFIAKKGDVLIWHGRLMHRGTEPKNPTLLRKALIAHYSGVNHRPDMPNRAVENGGVYAVFNHPLWGKRG